VSGNPDCTAVLTDARDLYCVGNSFIHQDRAKFSTPDRDTNNRCAYKHLGAWWYKGSQCQKSQLTGLYLYGENKEPFKTVNWYEWKKESYSLKFAEMKVRPRHL